MVLIVLKFSCNICTNKCLIPSITLCTIQTVFYEKCEKLNNLSSRTLKGTVQLTHFDCVRTPITSAYRSAMMCTLPVLGPQYLEINKGYGIKSNNC